MVKREIDLKSVSSRDLLEELLTRDDELENLGRGVSEEIGFERAREVEGGALDDEIPMSDPEVYDDPASLVPVRKPAEGQFGIICSACKERASVPFKPKFNSPVFCKDCFAKKR